MPATSVPSARHHHVLGRETIEATPPHMMQEFLSPHHMLFNSVWLFAGYGETWMLIWFVPFTLAFQTAPAFFLCVLEKTSSLSPICLGS